MWRNRFTSPIRMIATLLAGHMFAILAVPFFAQTAGNVRRYDVTREITLRGTVSGVLTKPAPGAWGSHLLIDTMSGTVDASLGRWGMQGKGGLSASVGQRVEVIGVMTTFNGRQVFMARAVEADGKFYTIRNERGTPLSPQARERAVQKGEQR
jgi:hypothetical protein